MNFWISRSKEKNSERKPPPACSACGRVPVNASRPIVPAVRMNCRRETNAGPERGASGRIFCLSRAGIEILCWLGELEAYRPVKSTMQNHISRRTFLSRTAVAGTALGIGGLADTRLFAAALGVLPEPSAKKLPRWLGFNFVRLPMDYRMWIEDNDWTKFHEPTLKEIDEAVKFCETHGVHVNLNFHRAPGYTVAQPPEPKPVWSNDEALRVCALHWATFAKRYQGIPNRVLSFNLFNEPAKLEADTYRRVVAHIVEAIRKHDKDRLIICDGREWGNVAPTELIGLGVAAATRGYRPSHVSHYQASWVNGADKWSEPTWPIKEGDTLWNKETLRERQIEPWKKL